jgi:hypothetical protein
VAEKGLPSSPLDKSEPQPAVDVGIFGNSDTYTPSPGDDESGAGRSTYPGDNAERPPPEQGADRGDFWDWLFNRRGRDESGRPSAPQGDDGQDSN